MDINGICVETRVYVINCDSGFEFRSAERVGDYESIKSKAEELGTVYSLAYFQEEMNSENLDLNNSFIYIEQPKVFAVAPELLEALTWALPYLEKLNKEKATLGFGMGLYEFKQAIKKAYK